MPSSRGCKSLKDGHCAFMAHSTLLTTLRNMASAHKIFKRCWLYRDLERPNDYVVNVLHVSVPPYLQTESSLPEYML
jgi:hypothetical protein